MFTKLKERHLNESIRLQKAIFAIAFHLIAAVLGFFLAKTRLPAGIFPLGIGFAAGLPLEFSPAAAIGAFAGYIPSLTGSAFSYIAAIFAVLSVRFILGRKSRVGNPFFLFVITSVFTAVCRCFAAAGVKNYMLAAAEGVIAGAYAYFSARTAKLELIGGFGSTPDEISCLIMSVCITLTGLYPVTVGNASVGRVLSVVFILTVTRIRNSSIGAVCGIAVGLGILLSGGDVYAAGLIAIAGCLCGIFSAQYKIVEAAVFSAVMCVYVIFKNASTQSVSLLLESVIGGAVFTFLPESVAAKINSAVSGKANIEDFDGLRKLIVQRLGHASVALRDVCETVETVSGRLSEFNTPDFEKVLSLVERDACRGCSFRINCWETRRKETVDAMIAFSVSAKRGEPLSIADIPIGFAERCLRLEWVETAFSDHYADFCGKMAAEQRIVEMREVVSDQFNGISDMLADLADEFKNSEKFDNETAIKISSGLKSLDMRVADCGCCIDKFGRMFIEIKLSKEPSLPFNRLRVLNLLEDICGRRFEPPSIMKTGGEVYVNVTEKANYTVEYAVSSYNCNNNVMCGDATECFYDGRGRFYMLLCDGMGNGGRAAVDGAMAAGLMSRLLKSGFGYECSLKIINSAMIFKSTDESLSTVDIACVDLFTGQTDLYKAGAAPTLVRRNGRTGKAECHSLPIGILRDVNFDTAGVTLKEDDIVLLMSDGATGDGTDWICAELESWGDGSAKQLSDHIISCARRRRCDGHEDDITVISAILQKAV